MYTRPAPPTQPGPAPRPQANARLDLRPYLIRLGLVFAFSVAFAFLFNEGSHLLQKENYDRPPKTIQLVIPAGTSERVEAGENVPAIPEEMIFVVGDVLEVKNEDRVSHQLGPIWVPPGSTGSLVMQQADKLAYQCSFQATRYLGVDIRKPTTLATRMTGLMIGAPTMTALIFIYSLLIFPVQGHKRTKLSR